LKSIRLISVLFLFLFVFTDYQSHGQINGVPNLQKYDYAPYHFGFTLAANQMFFTVKPIHNMQNTWFYTQSIPEPPIVDSARVRSLEAQETSGFTIGIVTNLRVGEFLDLRFLPDLAFGERELVYEIEQSEDGVFSLLERRKKIYSTFVEFPLNLKYKALRLQNNRAYVLGGIKYTLDLASEAKKNQDEVDDKHVKINKNDLMAELGVGFDFYTTYFKFGIEIKMSYGFNDVLVREENIYTASIDKLYSKLFQFSFTFE
jgi:hypothetical protein